MTKLGLQVVAIAPTRLLNLRGCRLSFSQYLPHRVLQFLLSFRGQRHTNLFENFLGVKARLLADFLQHLGGDDRQTLTLNIGQVGSVGR